MTAPARSARQHRPRHSAPRRPRWGLRLAVGAAIAVLGAGGIGHAVVSRIDGGLGRVDPFGGLSDRPGGGQGMNILIVGTDGRDKITEQERRAYHLGGVPCHCTDTMMLVHLSDARDRASVVSLPRDTYTEIPEYTDATGRIHPTHPLKLNAAYAEGGPPMTVRSVERLTGVHVDHYLEVDFTSFMKTVDVVGGVQVCTERPLKDGYTGLDLPAGASRLGGGQALQYVRSRHLDGAADLGRMQRQQRFLAALMHQAANGGVLLNPVKFREVASTVIGSVRADRGLEAADLVELGRAMKSLNPASAEFTSVPIGVVDFPVPQIGSTVKWDEAAAGKLFRALREDRPLGVAPGPHAPHDAKPSERPPGQQLAQPQSQSQQEPVDVAPGEVRVQVYNGTGRAGLARTTDQELHAAGFATTGLPADAPPPLARQTVITYDPRWDRSVHTIAAALPGARLQPVPGQGPLMKVTLGTDFTGVHPVQPRPPVQRAHGTEIVTGDQVVCPQGL
ncbi:LCP family protein required for cell wall assembly [Streptomyces olivoverticillatus]|uniref:LCP family protein required for cell wall assembly n=1 Tax=Streptomyces olivoverticillatus TaxID=66427 RepID=A0A7W7PL22_9ACTN|nr:LCP family protein [Streptomyces olivoverticillatus]MBB4894846.1 LCP family protein required for cell wall assembly [Streptomyces olivoverticillatus]